MIRKRWLASIPLLVVLALLLLLWVTVQWPALAKSGDASTQDIHSAVALGQPGLSFRYVKTFGETETAYFTDTAHINYPFGLGTDGAGVWIADSVGRRVLTCTASGPCATFIGKAGFHFPCEETELDWITDVEVDGSGNVWVVDGSAHHVVKFDADGNYVSELGQTWESGSDNDHFDNPRGIAFDSAGNVYVSDAGNHRVQVFNSSSTHIATIGVSGVSGADNSHFDWPERMAIDGSDNLYVTDYDNHRVQIFDGVHAYVATIGVSGVPSFTNDHLENPMGVATDASHIYVADAGNHRVQIFNLTTRSWQGTIGAGSAGSDNEHFNHPSDVAVDVDGNIYVADCNNTRVQVFNSSRVYQNTYGTSGVPYLTDDYHYNYPRVAIDGSGNVIILEERGQRLIKLDASSVSQWAVGEPGVAGSDNSHFSDPRGVAVDGGGRVYVADSGNHRVQIYSSDGGYSATLGTGQGSGDGQFDWPTGVAVSQDGRIYVSDTNNHRVEIYDSDHHLVGRIGVTGECNTGNYYLCRPAGVTVDSAGNVYVADTDNCRIQKFNSVGVWLMTLGTTGACGDDFSQLNKPEDVAVDSQGRIYVADIWNNRVQIFDKYGAYLTTIGGAWGSNSGQLRGASGVDVDSAGNVYVADLQNARIQKFAPGVLEGWKQVNINGFGYRSSEMVSVLAPFDGRLYAGMYNPDTGAQLWRQSPGAAWTAVFTGGFGDASNVAVDHLIEFEGHLYAGTWNETAGGGSNGGQIWRSATGDPGDWHTVASGGFTSTNNSEVFRFAVFNDQLYAATWNPTTGGELWRSSSGDGGSWVQVVTGGFGDADNKTLTSLVEFNSHLYAGTDNSDTGGEVWRSDTGNGGSWSQVNANGFGDSYNWSIALKPFNGHLYAGTYNYRDSDDPGAELWRCQQCDGSDWEQVSIAKGFGDTENRAIRSLVIFDDVLYAFTHNRTTGMEVWRTTNGTNWEQVGPDGLGDSNNYSPYWDNSVTVFNESLYVGTWNPANGGEVWCNKTYPIYLPLVLRNFFINPYEDYDSWQTAYGPLVFGREYRAYPDDGSDYYYFELSTAQSVTILLQNYQATGDLILYKHRAGDEPECVANWGQGGSTMTIGPRTLQAGKYYVRVYSTDGHNTTALYTLTVTY